MWIACSSALRFSSPSATPPTRSFSSSGAPPASGSTTRPPFRSIVSSGSLPKSSSRSSSSELAMPKPYPFMPAGTPSGGMAGLDPACVLVPLLGREKGVGRRPEPTAAEVDHRPPPGGHREDRRASTGPHGAEDRVPDRHREPDEGGVAAEVVANEEQRVTQLQVLDDRRRRAQARVPDHGVPHHADLPARAPGSLAEVGLLAVGEVALVEEPDLVQARSAGDHQRAVGVAGGLPA